LKFQDSTLDESNHLLVKPSCKTACENLFAANIAVEQEVIVAGIVLARFICTRMGVERIFPGWSLGDFSKIFLEGPKSGEICFFPLETKKKTLFC